MEVNYGYYSYVDPNNKDKNRYSGSTYGDGHKFDNAKFERLLQAGRYREAAAYGRQFRMNNPEQQRKHRLEMEDLERQAARSEMMLKTARQHSLDYAYKVDFLNNRFRQNPDADDTFKNNPITAAYQDYKRKLGSVLDVTQVPGVDINWLNLSGMNDVANNKIKKEAESLELYFKGSDTHSLLTTAKQYARGILGGPLGNLINVAEVLKENKDSLADKINKRAQEYREHLAGNLQTGLKNFAVSKEELQEAGVEIKYHGDGSESIKFDKSNPIADRIIQAYISSGEMDFDGNVNIIGYDAEGNQLQSRDGKFGDILNYKNVANKMSKLVWDSLVANGEVLNEVEPADKVYSGQIGTGLFDGPVNMIRNSGLSPDKQEEAINKVIGQVYSVIKSMNYADTEMYVNNGEDPTIETLFETSPEERVALKHLINTVNNNDIQLNTMVRNGEAGVLVTFTPGGIDKSKMSLTSSVLDMLKDDALNSKTYQIFIPGLFSEMVQESIDNDTNLRATKEFNDMNDYLYDYKTVDDNLITIKNGKVYYEDYSDSNTPRINEVSKEDAIRMINQDIIVKDAMDMMPYHFANSYGEIIDPKGYEELAKTTAMSAANVLYPDYSLLNTDGKPYTMEDILNEEKLNEFNTSYLDWMQIKSIRDIYNKLMQHLYKLS